MRSKKGLSIFAALAAMLAAGMSAQQIAQTAPQATHLGKKIADSPKPNQTKNVQTEQTATAQAVVHRRTGDEPFSKRGFPPKEWGQYLQGRGKQKWTKARC